MQPRRHPPESIGGRDSGAMRLMPIQLTLWTVIIRHCPVAVQGNADLAALLLFEFLAVELNRIRMGQDDTVSDAVPRTRHGQAHTRDIK